MSQLLVGRVGKFRERIDTTRMALPCLRAKFPFYI